MAAQRLSVQQPLPDRSGDFSLPPDGWYHLAPFGEFSHYSGTVQIIDRIAVDCIVAQFNVDMPGGFPGLLLDYEHDSHSENGSTAAAGWIEGLESRADGLWGNIRWTVDGKAAVAGGSYRFVSPTWYLQDCQHLPDNKIRPQRLADVGLTNRPNLEGLTPLSHRAMPQGRSVSNRESSSRTSEPESILKQQRTLIDRVKAENPGIGGAAAYYKAKQIQPGLFTMERPTA